MCENFVKIDPTTFEWPGSFCCERNITKECDASCLRDECLQKADELPWSGSYKRYLFSEGIPERHNGICILNQPPVENEITGQECKILFY